MDGVAGNTMMAKSGDVSMFLVDWYTPVHEHGRPADERVACGEELHTAPHEPARRSRRCSTWSTASSASTTGVLPYDFTASTDAFSAGKTAMMMHVVDDRRRRSTTRKSSKVADKVDVALPPGTGEQRGQIVRGGWGMGIPKNAQNKDAAWTVITYLTSKEWEQYQVGDVPDRPDAQLGLQRPGV